MNITTMENVLYELSLTSNFRNWEDTLLYDRLNSDDANNELLTNVRLILSCVQERSDSYSSSTKRNF